MSAEPFAVTHKAIREASDLGVLESMLYPREPGSVGPYYRTDRLTIRGDEGAQYAVFGFIREGIARDLLRRLPSASRALHGLKVTVDWNVGHVQVDDPGDSDMKVGEIYTPEGLGRTAPILEGGVEFADHSARQFYRERIANEHQVTRNW